MCQYAEEVANLKGKEKRAPADSSSSQSRKVDMTRQARCQFWQNVQRAFSEVADDIRRIDVPVNERMSGNDEFVGASTQVERPVSRPPRLERSMYLVRMSRACSKNGSSGRWAVTERTVCGSWAAARYAAPVTARAVRGSQCIAWHRVKSS